MSSIASGSVETEEGLTVSHLLEVKAVGSSVDLKAEIAACYRFDRGGMAVSTVCNWRVGEIREQEFQQHQVSKEGHHVAFDK